MHLADGVLSLPVLAAGGAVAVAATARGLRALDADTLPRTAVMSSAFFVASLIHVPLGPASVHPLLAGLMGLVLGWGAVPAVLVALVLQAVFLGHGGLTTVGVNTVCLALPAVGVHALVAPLMRRGPRAAGVAGALAGAAAVGGAGVLAAGALALSGKAFLPAAGLLLAGNLPLLPVEATITGAAAGLLARVRPDALAAVPVAGAADA